MKFQRLRRMDRVPIGYRLATLSEARAHLKILKQQQVLEQWDIARLKDGWIDGPRYGFKLGSEYRDMRHLVHKLAIKLSADYELSEDGARVALVYDCEEGCVEDVRWLLINFRLQLDAGLLCNGWTPLHIAAAYGHTPLCSVLVQFGANVNSRNHAGASPLHLAAEKALVETVDSLLNLENIIVGSRDNRGMTALHYAIIYSNVRNPDIVSVLLDYIDDYDDITASVIDTGESALHLAVEQEKVSIVELILKSKHGKVLCSARDSQGQTSLYRAITTQNREIVDLLLSYQHDPLSRVTDNKGRTVLHFVALLVSKTWVLETAKKLIEHASMTEDTGNLLSIVAPNLGTALECAKLHDVRCCLKEFTPRHLRDAAMGRLLSRARKLCEGPEDLAWLQDPKWLESLKPSDKANAVLVERSLRDEFIIKDAQSACRQASDLPAFEDSLGRSELASGLVALLLNPYTGTPLTVGIYGEWGSGKSSLMAQVEIVLLQTAIQQALVRPFLDEGKLVTNTGKKTKCTIESALKGMLNSKTEQNGNFIAAFADHYRQEYYEAFKCLALTDVTKLVVRDLASSKQHSSLVRSTPAILTVRYNAWLFQSEIEALAGLAVAVMKEVESAMTMAQWLSMCWHYTWSRNREAIYVNLIIPIFLTIAIGGWIFWIAWRLLSLSSNEAMQSFKYGSLPVSALVIVFVVMHRIISILQPVSSKVIQSLSGLDHASRLGYHQSVINDIQFLVKEVRRQPCTGWHLLGAQRWFWRLFGKSRDYVIGTKIPKQIPPDDLRIIVFVDDLDRCNDDTVLRVLSGINLVLAVCEINVVLGIDRSMVHRAIAREFGGGENSEEQADKFLNKIIQLPVTLPDPDDHAMKCFLGRQMGFSTINKRSEQPRSQNDLNKIRIDPVPEEGEGAWRIYNLEISAT